jgi:hypothetical protein
MQHLDMKCTADYLMRGRLFKALNVQELTEIWVAAVKAAAATAKANAEYCDAQTVLGDTMAEFSLRSLEPPIGRVEEQLEVVRTEVARWGIGSALEDELRDFMEGRLSPTSGAHGLEKEQPRCERRARPSENPRGPLG